ncbi:MAG TPA: hypothetical protein VGL56_16815 [Fimbriimonadaceae bacterium]|jgi:hypothetical protein
MATLKLPNDRTFSAALNVGLWMSVGGFFLGAFILLAGAAQGRHKSGEVLMVIAGVFIAIFFIGIFVLMYTLAAGIGRANGTGKTPMRFDNTFVVARYAISSLGDTVFDESYIDRDDPSTKFYVRLNIPNIGSAEYRCNEAIWQECGESMMGTALIQGNWIGSFTRYIGHGQGNPHEYGVAPQ